MNSRNHRPVLHDCENCGKTFEKGCRGNPKRFQRFCSRQCASHRRYANYERPVFTRGEDDNKLCPKCGIEKPPIEFPKDKSRLDGLFCYCLECSSLNTSKHFQATIKTKEGRAKKRLLAWRSILKTYGLTEEDYQKILDEQNGLCAICRKPETYRNKDGVRPLCVDHDHLTGRVRGLLCHSCNVVLGLCHEESERLIAAAQYLRKGLT